jgi:hypothetical protein
LAALGVLSALVYVGVGRLPSSGWDALDAFVGFAAALVVLGGMCWTVVGRLLPSRLLGILAVGGLVGGGALSWAGLLALAAPVKAIGALSLGCLLALQLDRAWLLVLIALLAFLADIWSVFAGPTRVIVERAPGVLDYLLVHFPAMGYAGPGTALGMSDWVFLALFTVGSRLNGLRPRATFAAMMVSLGVTFLITMAFRRPLPALPLLGLAFLLANLDLLWARRPRRRPR